MLRKLRTTDNALFIEGEGHHIFDMNTEENNLPWKNV